MDVFQTYKRHIKTPWLSITTSSMILKLTIFLLVHSKISASLDSYKTNFIWQNLLKHIISKYNRIDKRSNKNALNDVCTTMTFQFAEAEGVFSSLPRLIIYQLKLIFPVVHCLKLLDVEHSCYSLFIFAYILQVGALLKEIDWKFSFIFYLTWIN